MLWRGGVRVGRWTHEALVDNPLLRGRLRLLRNASGQLYLNLCMLASVVFATQAQNGSFPRYVPLASAPYAAQGPSATLTP